MAQQFDAATLAAALRGRGGNNAVSFGGGSILSAPPEQRMRMALAQQLASADPASARTKGEGMARLGQQLLGAYLTYQGAQDAQATQQKDASLMAAALRSQDRTPTSFTNDAGEKETITWNKPDPGRVGSILSQGSPRLQEAGLELTLAQQQREADRAAKAVKTLTPAEAAAAGYPAGSVVQRDAYGADKVVSEGNPWQPLNGGSTPFLPSAPTGGTQTVPRTPAGGETSASSVRPAIERAALAAGVDPAFALTSAHIESSMGSAPDRKGSQYQGIFQMGDDRWREAGGTPENRGDRDAQVNVGVKGLGLARDQLAQKLSRQPEPWEAYLAHQQGVAGAFALLSNPDAGAVETLAPFYKNGRNLQAILGNIPGGGSDANISARDFTGLWRDQFNGIGKNYGLGAPSQVAQGAAAQDMAAGIANRDRVLPPGGVAIPEGATPVQVAQANTGSITDAAPAGAVPSPGEWTRYVNRKGDLSDFEVNRRTGERRTYQQPPEPSDLGKLRAERDALPAGSPDRALYDADIAKKTGGAKPPGFEVESDLRDKFNGLQPVKNFREVVPIYQSMRDAMTRDNPAADLNLVYGVAKIMDPASVVREGETQMAVQTGSPAERFAGMFNYVVGGGRLTPEIRQNLFKEAESRLDGHRSAYEQTRDQYMDLARNYNVDPKRSIIDIRIPDAPIQGGNGSNGAAQGAPAGRVAQVTNDDAGRAAYDAMPSGTVFTAPDGTTRRKP